VAERTEFSLDGNFHVNGKIPEKTRRSNWRAYFLRWFCGL